MFQSVFPLPPTFQKQRWTVSEKGADGLYEPFFKISIGENVDSKAWCHSSYLVDEMTFDLLFPGFTKLLSRYSWSRPFLECKSSPPNLFMCPDDYPKCSPWVVPITSLWFFGTRCQQAQYFQAILESVESEYAAGLTFLWLEVGVDPEKLLEMGDFGIHGFSKGSETCSC